MEKGAKNKPKGEAPSDGAAVLNRCSVENCKKKAVRMNFCEEHYLWFKEGLVNKEGRKPKDFDKKYQNYLRKNKPAA